MPFKQAVRGIHGIKITYRNPTEHDIADTPGQVLGSLDELPGWRPSSVPNRKCLQKMWKAYSRDADTERRWIEGDPALAQLSSREHS